MAFTLSPNMSLPIPGVGTEAGPTYASDINSSLAIVDQHNHSAGSGVQITPSGINISSTLPMNGNQLSLLGSAAFQAQTADQGLATIYVKGVDLYYEDGSSNVIRITQSGSVAGSTGTITGLPSGTASASYSAGTFVFQSATNTSANVDGGSFVFRNNTANSFGVTLQPQNSLGSNYTLTLPSIPAQTNVMTLDASGNMGSTTWDQVGVNMSATGANAIGVSMTATGANAIGNSINSVTPANNIANLRVRGTGSAPSQGGVASSPSSGVFNTTSTSYVAITGLQVTLVTGGSPVWINLVPANPPGALADFNITAAGGNNTSATYAYTINGIGVVSEQIVGIGVSGGFNGTIHCSPNGQLVALSAGTYVISCQVKSGNGSTVNVNNFRLMAYEL